MSQIWKIFLLFCKGNMHHYTAPYSVDHDTSTAICLPIWKFDSQCRMQPKANTIICPMRQTRVLLKQLLPQWQKQKPHRITARMWSNLLCQWSTYQSLQIQSLKGYNKQCLLILFVWLIIVVDNRHNFGLWNALYCSLMTAQLSMVFRHIWHLTMLLRTIAQFIWSKLPSRVFSLYWMNAAS